MSDTTETETETDTNTDTTDEPSKAELHERVEQLESTVEKLMPSRRDALKLGAAGIAGVAGLRATTQPAEAATGSAGTIGSSSDRPDAFLDEANVNQLTGVSTGGDRQGCRVNLSTDQSIQGGAQIIQFDSEVYDSGNNFDTSSHAWTCPKDGLYVVNLQANFGDGKDDEDRRVLIGTAIDPTPNNEGAGSRQKSADLNDRISITTINKYQAQDTIAGYVRNNFSSDSLKSGTENRKTMLEVAFLGGL